MRHTLKSRFVLFLPLFLFVLFSLCMNPSAEEQKDNPPEEKKEAPEKGTKEDISKYIVESETGVYYIVQEGDTLWDLSRRFSDTPYVWPDLWKENKQITNPHLIYPGEKIRLYRKTDTDELLKKSEEEEEEKEPETPKVAKVIPKKEEEKPYYFYSAIDSIGFIKRKSIQPRGYIFKVKENKELIGYNDLIYVSPYGKESLNVGEKYTLYRTITPIKGAKTRKYRGVQYYLTGIIEIVKKEDKFSVARVVQSFRNIKIDDLLTPYERRDPKIYLTESKEGLEGKIIVSEERTEYFGDDFVAFIDKGSRDGVRVGQFYTVYYQSKESIEKGSGFFSRIRGTKLTPVDFAKILVLHTEERTSTVLITQSDISLYPGATFREAEE